MTDPYTRGSRETGLYEFIFKVRGRGGIVFDYVIIGRHASQAQAEVRALFGDHVIALQEVRRISGAR
jgi:hypothetical protein